MMTWHKANIKRKVLGHDDLETALIHHGIDPSLFSGLCLIAEV